MNIPVGFWIGTVFLLGICIGSYLNVVIYRLPLGQSTADPQWSFCPNCPNDPPGSNRLAAIDLIPLVSYLALGRKCRRCKLPISPRYFTVELLTGLLFVALYLRYPANLPTAVALLLFGAVLIPIFYIDLTTFQINDSLNLLAFGIAFGRDIWGIVLHEPGHALLLGFVPRSLVGGLTGILIFGAIRIAGWLWKRVEALGLGDVLLARAMGAMLVSLTPAGRNPLYLFPIWLVFACFSGLVVGPIMILLRKRGQPAEAQENPEPPELEESGTLAMQFKDIFDCLRFLDAVDYVRGLRRPAEPESSEAPDEIEEEWTPAPSAIPFGPFMVIGFLATAFAGAWITGAYLAWALPKPAPPPP